MKQQITEIKPNDVFKFRYSPEVAAAKFEPYHCFDGTLIARQRQSGLVLEDTYWSTGDGRTFTLEKALEQGTLTFVCNLDEVDKAAKFDRHYYSDEDFIELSIHHGFQNECFLRKGAQRSQAKMMEEAQRRIAEAESAKKSAEYDIKRHKEDFEKIKAGDTSVWF